MIKVLALFGTLFCLANMAESCGTVLNAFKRHELIPDVLDHLINSRSITTFKFFNMDFSICICCFRS